MPKIKKNRFGLIIGSFLIAIFLWGYIVGEESVEVSKRVPLSVETPEGITIANDIPEQVTVRMLIPRNLLSILESRPIEVKQTIMEEEIIGNYTFTLTSRNVQRPSAMIKIVQIIPERMMVKLDRVIQKKLPIKPQLKNDPADGYRVGEDQIQLDPNAVLVSGAKSVLEQTDYIFTEPIDLVGRIRSFRKKVSLAQKRDYQLETEGLIDIFIPIREESSQVSFKDIPIRVINSAASQYNVAIDPQKAEIFIKGPLKVTNELKQDDLMAFVNVVGLEPGEYQLPVNVNLPKGVSLQDPVPVAEVSIISDQDVLGMARNLIAEVNNGNGP